jgi:type II secretory pathway component PulK
LSVIGPPSPPRQNTGFVLVATLVAIAIITLGATFFAAQVDSLRESARQTQRWTEAEREAFSLREALQYAAATGTRTEAGLIVDGAVFALDGRRYKVSDTISLRVQDERGLLSINTQDQTSLSQLLSALGVPVEWHAGLSDSLLDYIDPDDFVRLNGAERRDYLAARRPQPANDFLRTREQIADVKGWDALLAILERAETQNPGIRLRFIDLFSASRQSGLNVNSAPAAVLAATRGIDAGRVAALLDQRRAKPMATLADLQPFTSSPLDSEYIGFFSGNDWRVTVEKTQMPFLLECQLSITPGEPDRPTRIRECFRRPAAAVLAGAQDEFQRAFGGLSGVRPTTEVTTSRTLRPVDRNDARNNLTNADVAAPDWLAAAVRTPGISESPAVRR